MPPHIGIFWVFNGKLIKLAAPLEKGTHTAEGIDSPFNHYDSWPALQSKCPELRDLGYEDVPRGRVLFLRKSKRFSVYMNKALQRPSIKKLILIKFHLPKTKTQFLTDPHYTTDPKELDRMFGRNAV